MSDTNLIHILHTRITLKAIVYRTFFDYLNNKIKTKFSVKLCLNKTLKTADRYGVVLGLRPENWVQTLTESLKFVSK